MTDEINTDGGPDLGPAPLPIVFWFVFADQDGNIEEYANAFSIEEIVLQEQAMGKVAVPCEQLDDWRLYWVRNGEVVLRSSPLPDSEPTTSIDVDRERDRRISAGFMFDGQLFQARENDLRNIGGAATGAAIAVMQGGAQPGDLRWSDPDSDFGWIQDNNDIMPMDAPTVIRFGLVAMAWVKAMTFAGRSIKNRILDGEDVDIYDDAEWPS